MAAIERGKPYFSRIRISAGVSRFFCCDCNCPGEFDCVSEVGSFLKNNHRSSVAVMPAMRNAKVKPATAPKTPNPKITRAGIKRALTMD